MKFIKSSFFFIFFLIWNCSNPLTEGGKANNAKVEWQLVANLSTNSAVVTWKCSGKVPGFLVTTGPNYNNVDTSFLDNEVHAVVLSNLVTDSDYKYVPSCGTKEIGIGIPSTFKTLSDNAVIFRRSIWIVGGIGSDKNAVSEIDYFDPVENIWHSAVTNVPTPRLNAQIVSFKNKIYVIGGIVKNGAVYTMSRLVEAYDPLTNTWNRNLSDIPSTLQGGVIGSFDEEIVILGGTTTTDMTTGTIFNTIYKFYPNIGNTGTWVSLLSSTNIFPRIDMAGCTYNGSLVFTGGRFYSDGLAYATTDAYAPSLNSTSGKIEASISLARHGSGYACYRPISTDPFPTDTPALFIAGGSTGTNISQPVTAVTNSNRFEYSYLGTASNAFVTGSNTPIALYYPAMEVSYEKRKLYLFGGASEFNLPVDQVYSLDLANPGGNPWVPESINMPRSRFGHKAIILSR
ncbi:Kelch motif protein [Leptospira meyeri]|uniref:Kelch motif protein n=1 Tax=Leptospira meyeri TaxID=29508 RepID=A0A4R8MW72_LEPME|nr:kelch repeat-containing protein [Leptospira meyeri]EKJ85127.1 kelch repeat protein [Leptospira meyeri serovar Hardjo str. Went 5]TDY71325.1 Kelch motif protein [Leptospira meyeri]